MNAKTGGIIESETPNLLFKYDQKRKENLCHIMPNMIKLFSPSHLLFLAGELK